MNYEEAMSFLEDTKQYGSRPGLESIRALMRELGDVQEQVPVVHIGGTNGKGSVGAMLSSVLTEAGYRVGWFNTPDVFSYEEEFRMDGEPIARERLAALFTEVRAACDRMTAPSQKDSACGDAANPPAHPTRFEVETAAAFLWFYEEKCDIALVEVGMGGALDATNLIHKPLVSVLTSIGLDHMNFLGDSLTGIAEEKAGIIKPDCPVVTVPQEPDVMAVIRARCEELHAPLILADAAQMGDKNNVLSQLALRGAFQAENAACALTVLQILQGNTPGQNGALEADTSQRFFDIPDNAIARGLADTRWPGRYECVAAEPTIILDGAHNESAAKRLREALDADFPGRTFRYIMGVLSDKDCDAIARAMFRPGDRVCTLTPPDPRALSAEELTERLAAQGVDAHPCAGVQDALSCVRNDVSKGDIIVAFGSLSYLREIREAICKA